MVVPPTFKTLEIVQTHPEIPVFHLYLNLPSTRNALSLDLFSELPQALSFLDAHAAAVVLAGRGAHFCSGIDISSLSALSTPPPARDLLRRRILELQAAVTAVERCRRPVVAAVRGACVGGGVDLVTACDLRVCAADAFFEVKEVDLAITADLGTLQRLPGIVGYGNAMEMALTGRRVTAAEAKGMGLVSRVFGSPEELESGAYAIAKGIAEKSPLAVMGTKAVLQKSRDLTVEQGLDYVSTWNSAMLLSDDLTEAISAHLQKRKPNFSKL